MKLFKLSTICVPFVALIFISRAGGHPGGSGNNALENTGELEVAVAVMPPDTNNGTSNYTIVPIPILTTDIPASVLRLRARALTDSRTLAAQQVATLSFPAGINYLSYSLTASDELYVLLQTQDQYNSFARQNFQGSYYHYPSCDCSTQTSSCSRTCNLDTSENYVLSMINRNWLYSITYTLSYEAKKPSVVQQAASGAADLVVIILPIVGGLILVAIAVAAWKRKKRSGATEDSPIPISKNKVAPTIQQSVRVAELQHGGNTSTGVREPFPQQDTGPQVQHDQYREPIPTYRNSYPAPVTRDDIPVPTYENSVKPSSGPSSWHSWTVDQVGAWLRAAGLEVLVDQFRAEEIDGRALAQIGDADVQAMKLPLGREKKIRFALSQLKESSV